MSTIPTLTDRLEAATLKAENGSAIMHAVANGDATTEVPTESGPVPSINKWLADLNDRTSGAVGQVEAGLEDEVLARQQADQALSQAIGVATKTNTHAAVAKDTPVNDDEIPLVDSEDSNNLKKLTWAKLKAGIFSAWGALINGGTVKATPVDADAIAIMDSGASNSTKKLLLSKLKAFVLTFTSANVASAEMLDLTGQVGKAVHITGTAAITAVTMAAGQVIDLIFDGALTLTHHATNNNLPSAANITTAAGDRARYFYDGTTVYCLQYQKADGTPVAGGATFASAAENVAGTVENKAVDPLGIREAFNATGTAPVYACRAWVDFNGQTASPTIRGSGNVSSVVKNSAGNYTINFTQAMPDNGYAVSPSIGASGIVVSTGPRQVWIITKTSTALRILITDGSSGYDPEFTSIVIHH